jgi:hypothetical protein
MGLNLVVNIQQTDEQQWQLVVWNIKTEKCLAYSLHTNDTSVVTQLAGVVSAELAKLSQKSA